MIKIIVTEFIHCPPCKSTYAYAMDALLVCPECGHEWNPHKSSLAKSSFVVKDVNGNISKRGDTVSTIKHVSVKGAPESN